MVEFIESIGTENIHRHFADSPKLLAYIEANLSGEQNAGQLQLLLQAVDESSYSLRQWVESLRTMQSWLDARNLQMELAEQIGYLCCAGEAAGSAANLTQLPALVAEMLDSYGCERATKKS